MRTHTLVGVDAALFMLISKYGFTDVLQPRLVVLDPSRVAAQIGNPPAAQVGQRHLGAAGPLVPKLLAAGQPVRACVQSHSSAEYLHALGVQEVVIGDLSEPTVLASAIQGAEKVYQLGPTAHPRERDMGFAMVDAAKTALPLKLRPVFEKSVFELSWSLERRQSLVDLDDVTDVSCMVLLDSERHAGATYELAAPGRYTAHELGAIIARVMGRPIEVREIDADTYLKAWVGDKDPRQLTHQLTVLRGITARYSSHDFVGNPNVLTWLLGRPPTTFEAYVRRQQESVLRKGDF